MKKHSYLSSYRLIDLIKSYLIVTISVILFSCEEYDNIPDNLRFKYHKGDTIVFKSNFNEFDTFVVNYVNYWYHVTDKQYYNELGNVDYKYLGSDSKKSLTFANNQIELSTEGFSVLWGDFMYGKIDTVLSEIAINKTVFEKVYDLKIDTNSIKNIEIYRIYYQGNLGVLKYWFKNGKEFEFNECIPN